MTKPHPERPEVCVQLEEHVVIDAFEPRRQVLLHLINRRCADNPAQQVPVTVVYRRFALHIASEHSLLGERIFNVWDTSRCSSRGGHRSLLRSCGRPKLSLCRGCRPLVNCWLLHCMCQRNTT